MTRFLLIFCVSLLASACVSTKATDQSLDPAKIHNLSYSDVTVTSSLHDATESLKTGLLWKLKVQLALLPQGTRKVRVAVDIAQVDCVDPALRYGLGWLGRDSKMTTQVMLLDETGTMVARFSIVGTANTGSYSGVYEEEDALAKAVSDGVAQALAKGT